MTGAIVREGARLTALGMAAGVVIAAAISRLLSAQLYGVSPHDPVSYAVTAAAIGLAALLACWVPAKRAVAVTPLDALRAE